MATQLKQRNARTPERTASESKVISGRVTLDDYETVAEIAEANGSSVAAVVEAALANYLRQHRTKSQTREGLTISKP
jgi:hypothetical protein